MDSTLPFKVKGFLSRNAVSCTFLVDYQGRDAALKVRYWIKDDRNRSAEPSKREFDVMTRLKGQSGIPVAFELLDDLQGTYTELGMDQSGKPWNHVVSEPNHFQIRTYTFTPVNRDSLDHREISEIKTETTFSEPYFHGAVVMEYLPDMKPLSLLLLNSGRGFNIIGALEEIIDNAHRQGIGFLGNPKFVLSKNRPYVLGCGEAVDLNASHLSDRPEVVEKIKAFDLTYLSQLSESIRRNTSRSYFSWAI